MTIWSRLSGCPKFPCPVSIFRGIVSIFRGMCQLAGGVILGGMVTDTARRDDVARVDAAEMVTILVTLGLLLVGFGLLALYEGRQVWLPSAAPWALLVVGGVSLVGALVVRGLSDNR